MAVTDNCIPYDIRFLEEFYPLLKGYGPKSLKVIKKLAKQGLIQRETFVEQVLADISGLTRSSIQGMDFTDKSDAKTVVSVVKNNNHEKGQWAHSLCVRRVKSKEGDLLVIGYNRLKDHFHFFRIPHAAYQHCGTIVEIVIEQCSNCFDGNHNFTGDVQPRKHGDHPRKWWKYEVSTIHDLFT